MVSFLEMNGIPLMYDDSDMIQVGLSVAEGSMNYEGLLQWIIEHKKQIQ